VLAAGQLVCVGGTGAVVPAVGVSTGGCPPLRVAVAPGVTPFAGLVGVGPAVAGDEPQAASRPISTMPASQEKMRG